MGWGELFPTRWALASALFVCVVAPVTLVALQVEANPKFSPVDEVAHFDYVDRVASAELPRQGEPLRTSTLREAACRGIALDTLKLPPCSTRRLEYRQFTLPLQYEAQQPPTYYTVAVPLRWVTRHVVGIDDKLRATRAANVVWLVAGLMLLWAAGRAMAIAPLALAATLLLLVASPMVVYTTATVSNDATAVFAAGLVALVAALTYARDGPRTPILLFAVGFAVAACKATNAFPAIAISALLAVAALTKGDPRRWLRDGGPLLLGALLAPALWAIVHRSLAVVDLTQDPSFALLRQEPRDFWLVLREAAQLWQPLTGFGGFDALSPDTLGTNFQVPLDALLSFLLMSAALAGLYVAPRRWPHALGAISLVTLYVWGVVVGAGLLITYDIYPGQSGRYGLALAPLLILVLAASVVGRWPVRLLVAFAVTSFLTTFTVMVT